MSLLIGLLLCGLAAIGVPSDAQEVVTKQPIPCVAMYIPLTPFELLGFDTCNRHVWKLILPAGQRPNPSNPKDPLLDSMGINNTGEAQCFYWDTESGQYQQIPCPKPGEVLGMQEEEVLEGEK